MTDDGKLCFGGRRFIVGIDTPKGSYTDDKNLIQAMEASAIEAGCRGDSVGMAIVNALKRIGRYDLLPPCER